LSLAIVAPVVVVASRGLARHDGCSALTVVPFEAEPTVGPSGLAFVLARIISFL
jgi:hypothetical protein